MQMFFTGNHWSYDRNQQFSHKGAVTCCIYTVYKPDTDLRSNTAAALWCVTVRCLYFPETTQKRFITGNLKICTSILCSDSKPERQGGRADDGIIIQWGAVDTGELRLGTTWKRWGGGTDWQLHLTTWAVHTTSILTLFHVFLPWWFDT